IYNGTGAHQTARLGARPGQKRVFHIEVENDGTALDSFVVRRWGRRPVGVGLRFFSGGRDVTALVASHSFVLRSLAPGATRRMRLVVRVFRRARLGTVRAWFVKFRSV